MKKLALAIILLQISLKAFSQDFRNAHWGDLPDSIKKYETAVFMSEESMDKHLSTQSFFEFKDKNIATYIYLFRDKKLYGVRCKISNLDGENSKYKALNMYTEFYEKYKALYPESISEKPSDSEGLKSFEIRLPNKKIYVNVKKENQDYFLYESFFKQ